MMKVNEKRISVASPLLNGNERNYVLDCLDTGWISSVGSYISRFEKGFAEFCNVKHAMSCSNGTVALHLAFLAYGIGPGDEVLVPTLTYIASANAVTYCGAKPVFLDSELSTWNLDPQEIEKKITPRTKAIMVVHLYGHPVDMDPVLEIAKKHKLLVVEDAAEAHGAFYKNRRIGSLGDIATFSFFGNKTITTGEGGMVLTQNDQIAEKIRLLKGQGMDPNRRYWFPIVGYNYRMTNIQAAIGLGQLEKIEWHLSRRREIASTYNHLFKGLEKWITLPREADWARSTYWMYSILLKPNVKCGRDELMRLLDADGIETRPIFYPMHQLPPYLEPHAHYPIAEGISAQGLNLPTHNLLTLEDLTYVVESVRKHVERE